MKVHRGRPYGDGQRAHDVSVDGEHVATLIVTPLTHGQSWFQVYGLDGQYWRRSQALGTIARYLRGEWCEGCPHALVCNQRRRCDPTPTRRSRCSK